VNKSSETRALSTEEIERMSGAAKLAPATH